MMVRHFNIIQHRHHRRCSTSYKLVGHMMHVVAVCMMRWVARLWRRLGCQDLTEAEAADISKHDNLALLRKIEPIRAHHFRDHGHRY